MPSASVSQTAVVRRDPGHAWTLSELISAAKPYGVSVESFLRRLVTLGRVPSEQYDRFRAAHDDAALKEAKPPGGNFYFTKARDLGKGYVRSVASAHRRALIDSDSAATYLDIQVGQIDGGRRNSADPFVTALAYARGGTVVTQETPRNVTKPRFPDVCEVMSIPWLTLPQFVNQQGWQMVRRVAGAEPPG